MKKACFFLTILLLCSALSASTTDVYRSTTEVSAYKKLVPTDTLVEEDDDIPESISFTIKSSDNSEIDNGSSSYSGDVSTYNQSFTAFKWEMTGNQYYGVSISFTLGPLYSGILDVAGSMNVSDAREVLPYTISFTNNNTTVSYRRSNTDYDYEIYDSALNKNNKGSRYSTVTADGITYRVYFADSKRFSDNLNSVSVKTSPETVGISLNLSTNSYACRNNSTNTQVSTPTITSCGATWTRSGTATVQLNLNSDKASWTDTSGENPITYLLSTGSHTYTATVIVTISAD